MRSRQYCFVDMRSFQIPNFVMSLCINENRNWTYNPFGQLKWLNERWTYVPRPLNGRSHPRCHSKRRRTAYTTEQLEILEQSFSKRQYITIEERVRLSRLFKINERNIKIWFQNRRTREKKQISSDLYGGNLSLSSNHQPDHSTQNNYYRHENSFSVPSLSHCETHQSWQGDYHVPGNSRSASIMETLPNPIVTTEENVQGRHLNNSFQFIPNSPYCEANHHCPGPYLEETVTNQSVLIQEHFDPQRCSSNPNTSYYERCFPWPYQYYNLGISGSLSSVEAEIGQSDLTPQELSASNESYPSHSETYDPSQYNVRFSYGKDVLTELEINDSSNSLKVNGNCEATCPGTSTNGKVSESDNESCQLTPPSEESKKLWYEYLVEVLIEDNTFEPPQSGFPKLLDDQIAPTVEHQDTTHHDAFFGTDNYSTDTESTYSSGSAEYYPLSTVRFDTQYYNMGTAGFACKVSDDMIINEILNIEFNVT